MASKSVSRTQAISDEYIQIPAQAMPEVRKMPAIGMAACAEIERLQEAANLDRKFGKEWPEEARVINPSGACAFADFASALMWLDCATPANGAAA